jgi:hypothetical protein
MSIAVGTQFLCDCGAEVVYLRPCQDGEAAAPTCACGQMMYPVPADEEEQEFSLVL